MKNMRQQANLVTNELLENFDENELYVELGLRMKTMEEDPSQGISFEPGLRFSTEEAMLDKEDWGRIGREIFNRWHVNLYGLICGSEPDDIGDRDKLFGDSNLLAGAIAVLLITSFGVQAAIAAVIAAIIVKRFFNPVYEVFCEEWKGHLPKITERA